MRITRNMVYGVVGFLICMVMLWLIVYNTRLFQIEKEVEGMDYLVDSTTNGLNFPDVESFAILYNDSEFTLEEINTLEDVPTVLEVSVNYVDDTTVTKPAYVVYDEIAEPEYKDGLYGKIILPMREGMEPKPDALEVE